MPPFAVILPAAGSSTRFGGGRSKLLTHLASLPVIVHSLRTFLARADVARIVIPARAESDLSPILDGRWPDLRDARAAGRITTCAGGANRAQSVLHALRTVPDEIEWVAVHDAARPLVSSALIDRVLMAAVEHGAAVPAMPVQLTIKQAVGPLPAPVQRTVPRQQLWAMQTPQIMRRASLLAAFEHCPLPLDQVTDDVQLLELAGREVWLVDGEERNLKVTTPLDLQLAELLVGQ